MLETILQYLKQLDNEDLYAFCVELFHRGASGVYCDEVPDAADKPKFIGLLAEIIEEIGGDAE